MAGNRHVLQDAALVVLGAVIAAVAGVVGPLVVQYRDDRRVERRDAQTARGAARVMLGGFVEAKGQMATLERDRVLRAFERPKRVELPQAVAEKLDGDSWGTVQDALANVAALATFVKTLMEDGRHQLTNDQACFVRADLEALRYAAQVLGSKLQDEPKDPPPRRSVDCGGATRPYGV